MGAIPSRFTYLPWAILLMTVEMSGVLLLSHYFHEHGRLQRESRAVLERFSENIQSMFSTHSADLEASSAGDSSSIIQHPAVDDYERESKFTVDKVCFGIGAHKIATYLLCLTRATGAVFFLVVDLIINMTSVEPKGSNWYYFTTWNCGLASGYYLLGLLFSIMGIFYSVEVSDNPGSGNYNKSLSFPSHVKFNQHIQKLAYLFFVCYEVAGATAMMVTMVNFSFIDPGFYFLNISLHLITTMSFLVEMSLNSQFIYMSHLPYSLAWVGLYILIIIPVVTTGAIPDWPYTFMRTDTSACFFWFTGLLFLDIFFYTLWHLLHRLKLFLKTRVTNHQGNSSNKYVYKSYLTNSLLSGSSTREQLDRNNNNNNNNALLRTTSTSGGEIFM